MKFLRGRADRGSPSEPTTAPALEGPAEALAETLRQWGSRAVEIGEVDPVVWQRVFEGWAKHVLLGAPPPTPEGEMDEVSRDANPAGPREWTRLATVVRDSRELEVREVSTGLSDLRDVVRLFIESFHRACVDDAETEKEVADQLGTLREAAENPDTEALRNTVRACVANLEEAGRARREREKKRLLALSDRVDKVSEELAAAREQMSTDALTGVYNRAGFDEQLSLIVQLGAIAAPAAFLFMIDVDHFKWVNDRYGHPAGDAVLAAVALGLTKTFRRKADFLARFGGDEFAAVILEADANAARAIGERMLFAAREVSVMHEDQDIRVGISVGAAPQRVGEDAAAWIERADRALYRAKEKGRDCLVVVS